MKTIHFLAVVLGCSIGYSDTSLQELYRGVIERPVETWLDWSADEQAYIEYVGRSEEEEALALHSEEIAKMDDEALCANPELVFRRASLWLDHQEKTEDISVIVRDLRYIAADFQFVAEHAEKGSRLERAAQLKVDFLRLIFEIDIEDEEFLYFRAREAIEMVLQQWAEDPTATGSQLREEVAYNIKTSSDIALAFTDYMILFFGEVDLALGYVQPTSTKVDLIFDPNTEKTVLHFEVQYEADTSVTSITFEL